MPFHLVLDFTDAFRKKNKGKCQKMLKLVRDHPASIPNVFFRVEFEEAQEEYKSLWKWITMELLGCVSATWKERVQKRWNSPLASKSFMQSGVTVSDFAFLYVLFMWGKDKWLVDGDVGGLDQAGHSEQADAVLELEHGSEIATCEDMIITTTVVTLDKTVSTLGEKGAEDLSVYTAPAGVGKKGRKPGAANFGSKANIAMFNAFGIDLEVLFDDSRNAPVIRGWLSKGVFWANGGQDVGIISEENSKSQNEKSGAAVPFIPKDRSDLDW
jgi:hypothetical protein